MADPRRYSRATLLALVGLGRATCYWPEPPCGQPVIVLVKGLPVTNLEIAHIHAAYPDGPRFREQMTAEQRRNFSNLILLCKPHHMFVDSKPDDFPAELLKIWKAQKEQDGIGVLSQVRGLTDENLDSHVARAMHQASAELREAIKQLKELSPVAADLLEAASASDILYSAATQLRGLTDAAELLYTAALRLPPNLEDAATALNEAASRLQGSQAFDEYR